jgi:hypothetical protein
MNVHQTTDSSDGGLRVKPVEPDRGRVHGRIQILELRPVRTPYHVTVRYSSGRTDIDYHPGGSTMFEFNAPPNDVTDITIVAVPAD